MPSPPGVVKGLRMRPERSATDVACFLAGDLFRRAFYTRRALADRRSAARRTRAMNRPGRSRSWTGSISTCRQPDIHESSQIIGGGEFHHHAVAGPRLRPRYHPGADLRCRPRHRRLFVAFKLPNLLRRIFAEGAFSQAFVPILAEYKNQQGEEATRTFIAYVSGLLTLVLALVTALGILAAPWVIWVTAPGFADTPEKFALTTDLLRVTFPYILLISLSSWPARSSTPGTASRCRPSCRPC